MGSLKLLIRISYRGSHREVLLENSCTFDNTKIILLSGTIGMDLKELYMVPLRRPQAQNGLAEFSKTLDQNHLQGQSAQDVP